MWSLHLLANVDASSLPGSKARKQTFSADDHILCVRQGEEADRANKGQAQRFRREKAFALSHQQFQEVRGWMLNIQKRNWFPFSALKLRLRRASQVLIDGGLQWSTDKEVPVSPLQDRSVGYGPITDRMNTSQLRRGHQMKSQARQRKEAQRSISFG